MAKRPTYLELLCRTSSAQDTFDQSFSDSVLNRAFVSGIRDAKKRECQRGTFGGWERGKRTRTGSLIERREAEIYLAHPALEASAEITYQCR